MQYKNGTVSSRLWSGRFLLQMVLLLLSGVIVLEGKVMAGQSGLLEDDPMVKISSLPIKQNVDTVLAGISNDVSRDTGIKQEYITYYWQTLDNINCMGAKTVDYPILVDFYVPGFFKDELIATFMTSLAAAIEKYTGVDKKWVFIHTHFPRQGQVYLSGKVMTWEDYQGNNKNTTPPNK